MKSRTAYLLLLTGAFLWCLLLFVPPIVAAIDAPGTPVVRQLYAVYAPICNQRESHSIRIAGFKTAVCSRCLAIYLGFLAAVLLSPFIRSGNPSARWLLLAAVPMLIDVGGAILGVHEPSLTSRLMTGSLFGIVSGLVLTPLLVTGISELLTRTTYPQGALHETKT